MTTKITEDMVRAAAQSFRGYLTNSHDPIAHTADVPANKPGTHVHMDGTLDLELPMLRALITVIPDAEIVPTGRWLNLGETMIEAADADPETPTSDQRSSARAARERGWEVGTRFTTHEGNYPFTVTAIGRRAVAAMGTSGPFIGVEGLIDYSAVVNAQEVTDADQ